MRSVIVFSIVVFGVIFIGCSSNDDLFMSGGDLLQRGDFAEAAKCYGKFARANAEHRLAPTALFNAASIAMMEMGELVKAKEGFLALTERYPQTKWATESYRRLAEICQEQGDFREAIVFYRLGLSFAEGEEYDMPEPWVREMAVGCRDCLDSLNNPQLSMEVFREISEFALPGEAAAQSKYDYAQACKAAGMEKEAASIFADLMYIYPDSEWARRVMAEERELVDEYVDFPWETVEQFGQLNALFIRGERERVREMIEDIIQRNEHHGLVENAECAMIIFDVHTTGDFETGLDRMQDFLDEYPDSAPSREGRQRIEIWAEILEVMDRIKQDPEDYGSHQELGFILLRERILELAEEHFKIALQDSSSDLPNLGLGYVYSLSGRAEESIEHFERYLALNPNDGATYNRVGYAYLQLNRLEDALRCFGRYRELEPNNPNTHDSYAECLWRMGRIDEAIAEYERALEIDASWSNGVFMLGEIYREMGENKKALEYYERYLEMDPSGRLSGQAWANIIELREGGV